MLAEALQSYLAADAGVQVVLGTPSTRNDRTTGLFPTQGPDEPTAPWVVYQQVSGNPLQESMQGTGRLTTERWRISCYGSTYKQAKQLAAAVKLAMISWLGTQGSANVQIEGSWHRLEIDEAELLPRGTVFATHMDFEIIFLDGV
jgi:hypothetical protein